MPTGTEVRCQECKGVIGKLVLDDELEVKLLRLFCCAECLAEWVGGKLGVKGE